jgi:hypothetical protein
MRGAIPPLSNYLLLLKGRIVLLRCFNGADTHYPVAMKVFLLGSCLKDIRKLTEYFSGNFFKIFANF